MSSESSINKRLLRAVEEREALTVQYQAYVDAATTFNRKWEEHIPVNPLCCGGHAATIVEVFSGARLLMVNFGETPLVYPVDIVGSIKRVLLPHDLLVVEDKMGRTRSLASMGIVPHADGSWQEHCISVRDDMDDLAWGISFLSSQGTEDASEAAEIMAEYVAGRYGVEVEIITPDGESSVFNGSQD